MWKKLTNKIYQKKIIKIIILKLGKNNGMGVLIQKILHKKLKKV